MILYNFQLHVLGKANGKGGWWRTGKGKDKMLDRNWKPELATPFTFYKKKKIIRKSTIKLFLIPWSAKKNFRADDNLFIILIFQRK